MDAVRMVCKDGPNTTIPRAEGTQVDVVKSDAAPEQVRRGRREGVQQMLERPGVLEGMSVCARSRSKVHDGRSMMRAEPSDGILDDEGRAVASHELSREAREEMRIEQSKQLRLVNATRNRLAWHRQHLFRGVV